MYFKIFLFFKKKHLHAAALESLKDHLKEGARALDVGSGTGYLTACFAIMVSSKKKLKWKLLSAATL